MFYIYQVLQTILGKLSDFKRILPYAKDILLILRFNIYLTQQHPHFLKTFQPQRYFTNKGHTAVISAIFSSTFPIKECTLAHST